MRCPYCGGLNADQARFCARCGRDIIQMSVPMQSPPPARASYTPNTASQRPPYVQPRSPQPAPATRGRRNNSGQQAATVAPPASAATPVVEPPVAFPPRTVRHLQDLEVGALAYTVLDESESYGRKKIVRIGYPSCAAWQQVATLYKALNAYRSAQFDTVIIQGISPERADKYNYTNGIMQFDQNVRLGSQTLKRYQIETGDGFSGDAIRIVLTEE
jgi:hypothetical protein